MASAALLTPNAGREGTGGLGVGERRVVLFVFAPACGAPHGGEAVRFFFHTFCRSRRSANCHRHKQDAISYTSPADATIRIALGLGGGRRTTYVANNDNQGLPARGAASSSGGSSPA